MLTVDINFCFTFDLLEDTYILASTQRILAIGAIRTLGFFFTQNACVSRSAPVTTAKTLTWAAGMN